MEEEKKIYLFDGSNHANWSFRMEVHLEELGLLQCIRAEVEDVAELQVLLGDSVEVKREKEGKLAERKKQDVKCKSVLVRNIADSQLEHIKGKRTPAQIWSTLENTFARKGISGQFYLLKKLSTMKFDESGPLQTHLLQFERMVRDLDSAGIKLQECLVVFYLLQTMPRSYGQLVTVLETLPVEQCTLDFVKSRLLSESVKRENCDVGAVGEDSTAFVGQSGNPPKFKCYSCGKVGHKRFECPSQKKSGVQKKSKAKNKEKAHCGESEVTFIGDSIGASAECTKSKWILDSGASDHMICCDDWLRDVKELDVPVKIQVASGETLVSHFAGKVDMIANMGKRKVKCTVEDVLLVSGMKYNLFSIRRLDQLGMEVLFGKNKALIKRNGEVVCCASRKDRLYELNVDVVVQVRSEVLISVKPQNEEELWHRRYGHIGKSGLSKLISGQMVNGLVLKKSFVPAGTVCEPCVRAKQTRKPFKEMPLPRSSRPLELIHSDVCGAMTPAAWNGKRYFITFTDDFTHFSAVYFLHTKDETLNAFQTYVSMAEAHFGSRISRLRCDNGGEYIGGEFQQYCRGKGIQLEYTVPYTPEQNGVSERLNRTIMDKARAMIEDSEMSKEMWNEAVLTAVYLINRSPTAALTENQTSYERWHGQKPDVAKLRIFGSKAFCLIPKVKRKKLDSRSQLCHLVGYGVNGYRVWDGYKIFLVRDAVIEESPLVEEVRGVDAEEEDSYGHRQLAGPLSMEPAAEEHGGVNADCSGSRNDGDDADFVGDDTRAADQPDETDHLRRSRRARNPPARLKDYICVAFALNAETYVEDIASIDDLKKMDDWPDWKLAIEEELSSLAENNTWRLVDIPEGRRPIDCKWVFRLKLNPDGSIQKRKARLVAKGFSQRYGFDYSETYAPVAKMSTVRTMLALANQHSLVVHQMDVKAAFLNGELIEDIYMRQPRGFEEGDQVCKLNKSIYGLKQASKSWNDRFNKFAAEIGFHRCDEDPCLYVRNGKSGPVYICLYVVDILIISKCLREVQTVKRMLKQEFKMVDLGEAEMFLGLKIERNSTDGVMKLSQPGYTEAVLRRFGMSACKPASTPMEANLKLRKEKAEVNLEQPYRELIGCLTYLVVTSRPELSAAVSYFSQFQCNPTQEHWTHVKRILRYLRGTTNHGLVYRRAESTVGQLEGFADANWATDVNDRHSVSGYLLQVHGSTTAWSTKKQRTVALSSTEAECSALADCVCEVLWFRKLFGELGILEPKPTDILKDNQSTIAIAESSAPSKRLKHTEVKIEFIRECVQSGKIAVKYIPTESQPADMLTKGLSPALFNKHCLKLGLQ